LDNRNRALWVAVYGGHIVGSTAICKKDEYSAEVQRVVTDVRMRVKGIARRLLRMASKKAKDMGVRTLTLHTSHPLKAAITLYRSEGFQQISETKVFYGLLKGWGTKF
ncbi:hypothetical protein CAPTEDRAFT_116498, partial [Capitella teleta]